MHVGCRTMQALMESVFRSMFFYTITWTKLIKWPGDFFEKCAPDHNENTDVDAWYRLFYEAVSLIKLEDEWNLRIWGWRCSL